MFNFLFVDHSKQVQVVVYAMDNMQLAFDMCNDDLLNAFMDTSSANMPIQIKCVPNLL